MRSLNLAIRFLLELTGVGVLAWWGYTQPSSPAAGMALAVVAPLALIAVWARIVAPKATNGLTPLSRMLVGSGLLLLCALALAAAGSSGLAAAFGATNLVNTAVLMRTGPPTVEG